ncbi:hypothetical protein ElyMa_002273800 [Elysia marginata]|uniref:Uncharacterized protein n=1 Tax=Elysia marginata TaxID=1093978 RepID=A0AAV4G2S4_9GAST|nr:hypothetical protein ElyMa_002273800 [Elysia marginata]
MVKTPVRMPDDRLIDRQSTIFYSEPAMGHRLEGRPTLRFKNTMKKSLQNCSIGTLNWGTTAFNRSPWRQLRISLLTNMPSGGCMLNSVQQQRPELTQVDFLCSITSTVDFVHLILDPDPTHACPSIRCETGSYYFDSPPYIHTAMANVESQ